MLQGALSDSTGDALTPPTVAVHPDLASATVQAANGMLTITVTYAPGTWSRTHSVSFVLLDLDENAATGFADVPVSTGASEVFGWEYQITAVDPPDTLTARVTRALSPTSFVGLGTVPLTFPESEAVRVAIPLSMLDNDDGRLRFRVVAAEWEPGISPPAAAATDFMPGPGEPVGVVR